MPANPISGAGYLLKGIRLIAHPGLRQFVIVPLLINIAVFAGAIWFALDRFAGLMKFLDDRIPSWLQWLDWILWPLFVALVLVIVFYGFSLVANLIASPFNSLLAEKVELHLTGRPLDQGGGVAKMLRELVPTLLDEANKILYALLLGIPFLFLLFFVPVVGPALWFLYTAWIMTVQYSDYPMGNHALRFREMRRRLGAQRALSLSFGAATAGLSMLPVINFIAMPSAVAGATAMWVAELRNNDAAGEREVRVAGRGTRS